MPIRTERRFGFEVYGDIQHVGSWGRCMSVARRYPDQDWKIYDMGPDYQWEKDRRMIVVTEHTAIKEVTGVNVLRL